MQRYKRILVSLLLAILFLLCACDQDSNSETTEAYPPNMSIETGNIFLYKPYVYQLGVYNFKLKQWERIDDGQTPVQGFGWGNSYHYFVIGQQYVNSFYAGKATESTLKFNFMLESQQEALVPFATDGDLFLYMIEEVTENNDFFKKIVTISDDGKTSLIANLDGMPAMGGVIVGHYLYFTCPVQNVDFYEVWRIDLNQSGSQQRPLLVRDDYSSYKIYQYQGKVLFLDSKKQSLYNDDISIKLNHEADLITIDSEFGVIAEMYVTEGSQLELKFTDISSKKVLGTYLNAINFTREGTIITIYGNGFIEHLDLSKGDSPAR